MIRNLGRVLTILTEANVHEEVMHDDVSAFGAPSECHDLVSKGEKQRLRLARRKAKSIAGRPMRVILREARKRGWNDRTSNTLYFRLIARLSPYGSV